MKKGIFKIIWKRLKSKNPKAANIIAIIATVLIAVFFGADNSIDLCDIQQWLCDNKELIYSVLLLIVGGSQFPISKESKHAKK